MSRSILVLLAFLLAGSVAMLAKDNPERTQVGRAIYVNSGETAGELTCFGCSIYVRGQVNGDATAFAGRIVIEQGGTVTGDATAFGGQIRAQAGSSVKGDATSFGGSVLRDSQASIGGDVTSFAGFTGLFIIAGLPILFLGGLIALVVWLFRRNQAVQPTYAGAASTRA